MTPGPRIAILERAKSSHSRMLLHVATVREGAG
jgi:hypothetical protein